MNKSTLSLSHLPEEASSWQQSTNNIDNYDSLKESINTFKRKFATFAITRSQSNSLNNSIDTIIDDDDVSSSSASNCEHIYDNFIPSDYDMSKFFLLDSSSSLMKDSCGSIDKNLK